jgi:uncharacterized protein (DUF2141 family)
MYAKRSLLFVFFITLILCLNLGAESTGFTLSGSIAIQKPGTLHIALVSEASAKDDKQAYRTEQAVVVGPDDVKNKFKKYEFLNVPQGTYIIQVYEDLNGNDKMDYGLFGIPAEPWGSYRWSRPFMSGPKLEEMLFTVDKDIANADFRVE